MVGKSRKKSDDHCMTMVLTPQRVIHSTKKCPISNNKIHVKNEKKKSEIINTFCLINYTFQN